MREHGTEESREKPHMGDRRSFYEFFAGAGMARLGLGQGWSCAFANDICTKKAAAYEANFGRDSLLVADIRSLATDDLPGHVDLAWASFPCQDLSLAGNQKGLAGERSGTFWAFHALMSGLVREHRSPRMIVLENVIGALTSNHGADFDAILGALMELGYSVGPMVIDAALFVPQSRPRLFIVAVREPAAVPGQLVAEAPVPDWHTKSIESAYDRLPDGLRSRWIWWNMPVPPRRRTTLKDLVEDEPTGVEWHSEVETQRLLSMMSHIHTVKVSQVSMGHERSVGTIYRRTRPRGEGGEKAQRAEVRFDGISGCLRTPSGGSSRQTIIVVENGGIRTRLLSPREAARLMGVPDSYRLPANYNEAYHLMGDGVAVPVVSWLSQNVLGPIRSGQPMSGSEAA